MKIFLTTFYRFLLENIVMVFFFLMGRGHIFGCICLLYKKKSWLWGREEDGGVICIFRFLNLESFNKAKQKKNIKVKQLLNKRLIMPFYLIGFLGIKKLTTLVKCGNLIKTF